MLQAKLEMETSANGPMASVGPRPCPQSKYGQKLKSFRNVVRTSLLNQNAYCIFDKVYSLYLS